MDAANLALRLEDLANRLAGLSRLEDGAWSARPTEAQELRDLSARLKREALGR